MTEFEIKQKIKSVLEKNPNVSADQFLASFTSKERSEVIDFLENAGLAQKLIFDNLRSINSRILEGTKNIKTLNLPKVKKISSFGRSKVREIFIGSSLKYLDQNAFMYLPYLEKVTFSEGIKRIPAECFKNLTNLEEVYLPESVQYIGGSAFEGCSSYLKIITPGRKPGSIFKCVEKDLEFLKSHIVFEEPIASESLTEAFSNSMPEWLKGALLKDKRLKRIFTSNNIDLNKCRFEDRDVSTIKKRKDPIITDSRYIQVWSVSDDITPERILVLPFMSEYRFGVGTEAQAQLACKYIPLKTYLEYARHFCYIDTLDSSIPDLQSKKEKRFDNRKDPYRDRFTQKERRFNKLDKSGYIIPSIGALKNRLISKYGDTLIYKKLEKCYEDLQELRDKIIDANNMVLSDDIRYMQSGYKSPIDNLQNAMSYFKRALDIYRGLVDQLEESNNLGMNFNSKDTVLYSIRDCLSHIEDANNEISNYNFTSLI